MSNIVKREGAAPVAPARMQTAQLARRPDTSGGYLFPESGKRREARIIRADAEVIRAGTDHMNAQKGFVEASVEYARAVNKLNALPEILHADRCAWQAQWEVEAIEQETSIKVAMERQRTELMREHAVQAELESRIEAYRAQSAESDSFRNQFLEGPEGERGGSRNQALEELDAQIRVLSNLEDQGEEVSRKLDELRAEQQRLAMFSAPVR